MGFNLSSLWNAAQLIHTTVTQIFRKKNKEQNTAQKDCMRRCGQGYFQRFSASEKWNQELIL